MWRLNSFYFWLLMMLVDNQWTFLMRETSIWNVYSKPSLFFQLFDWFDIILNIQLKLRLLWFVYVKTTICSAKITFKGLNAQVVLTRIWMLNIQLAKKMGYPKKSEAIQEFLFNSRYRKNPKVFLMSTKIKWYKLKFQEVDFEIMVSVLK